MNFQTVDAVIGRQRCRQWIPLLTQQLRLRHLYQVIAYNMSSGRSGSFYYTLHSTNLSSPFYKSENVSGANPKWAEIEFSNSTPLSQSGVILRIWQLQDPTSMDVIISTWAIHFSGLVYVGQKLSEVPPSCFKENTVILQMRGGYFTCLTSVRTDLQTSVPFIDYLNVVSSEADTKMYRNSICKVNSTEVKQSYNSDKLRRLHSLQIRIKNRTFDAEVLREKIERERGVSDGEGSSPEDTYVPTSSESPPVRYAPQLLTMTSLNKLLQEKPSKSQKREILRVSKELELAKFRTKILWKERNQKVHQLRQLKQKHCDLCDSNQERESMLMENYRILSKETEKLRESRKDHLLRKEDLHQISAQLHHRRRQLISQLLFMYPIKPLAQNKYLINGVHLPDSDVLTDCSDGGLSVALGYVAHVLTMCSYFLQVPLRYPITHVGSRSSIIDHISPSLSERDREFPLYTRGKDRMQFNYAVYLLNKNLAQLMLLCGQQTPDLRATLLNLLTFLQGKEQRDIGLSLFGKLEQLAEKLNKDGQGSKNGSLERNGLEKKLNYVREKPSSPLMKTKREETGPGVSDVLYIPEAFLNSQISSSAFRNYMNCRMSTSTDGAEASWQNCSASNDIVVKRENNCDKGPNDPIEQGTDLLDPDLNLKTGSDTKIEVFTEKPKMRNGVLPKDVRLKQKRKSRSVGSFTDEERDLQTSAELGSDPVINVTAKDKDGLDLIMLPDSVEDRQSEFLQKWLDSGPALVCSEENLYPEEILGTTATVPESGKNLLTVRTDALLSTTSFNLVKPKF